MTTAVARPLLALPPAEYLSPTSLNIPPGLSFGEWEGVLASLRACVSASSYWWGDALNYGEDCFNERYSQALEQSDLALQTLRNASYVCRHIPPERRRPELSFGHHECVAALDEADQELLLDQAVASGLTRNEMRELVKAYKANLDAEIKGKGEAASIPPAVCEADADADDGIPPTAEAEPEIDWQAEYARTAQENASLQDRVTVLATKNDLAQEVARLHEERAQALALVDLRNDEIRRLNGELDYRKGLLKNVMDALHVQRYTEITPAIEGLRK